MRFSIRDLLWLTLLVAIGAAWWVDHVRLGSMLPEALRPVPAEGLVTMRGQPLASAAVTVLYPDGNSAMGVTDIAGEFTLWSYGRSGAPPGKGLVVLLRTAAPNNLLPAKYASIATSPLRIDLPSSGSKSVAIELR